MSKEPESAANRAQFQLDHSPCETDIPAGMPQSPAPATEQNDYVAWLQYHRGTIRVCDSDAEKAFKVYKWATVEAYAASLRGEITALKETNWNTGTKPLRDKIEALRGELEAARQQYMALWKDRDQIEIRHAETVKSLVAEVTRLKEALQLENPALQQIVKDVIFERSAAELNCWLESPKEVQAAILARLRAVLSSKAPQETK